MSEVVISDDLLVADAIAAHQEAEATEEEASPSRWREADAYLQLSERGGQILVIETKQAGAPMTRGQQWAFENVSRRGITVLLQECREPADDSVTRVRFCTDGCWGDWIEVDRLGRDRLVQKWFRWADGQVAA